MNRRRDAVRCLRIRGDPARNPSSAETALLGPPPRASRILHGGLHRFLFVLLALGVSWACGSDEPYRPDPQATFSPAALAFEMTAIGDTARQTVALTSRFPRDFEITVRSNSQEFSVEGPKAFTLGAGKTRELVVRFHPATEGAKQGRVEVEGIRCDPLPCTGTADEDPCRVEPMELAFGWVRLGEARTLAFRVYGDGPEVVTGEVAASCEEFEITPSGPFDLAPGESLEVAVTYRPRDRGEDGCGVSLGHFWCEEVACRGTSSRQWWVREDGGGDAPTVQAAIDSAGPGDVVVVGPGRYYENIDLLGKGIHLKSAEGPERTILDGSRGDDTVVACVSGETNATVIEGFTITGGKGRIRAINGRRGAGLLCLDATPVIQGNIIEGNEAITPPDGNQSRGGGLLFGRREGSPELTQSLIVRDNVIRGNFASNHGGGVYLGGPCLVEDNAIVENRSGTDGAGLYIAHAVGHYRRNLIYGNEAGDHGGGMFVNNAQLRVDSDNIEVAQNLVLGNHSNTTRAPDCSGGGIWVQGGAHVHHNTVAFNHASSVQYPAGGGICMVDAQPGTVVEHNLVYRNNEGGFVAFRLSGHRTWGTDLRRNLLYANGVQEIHNNAPEGFEVHATENVFDDPLLCADDLGSRGELATNSPALNQPWGVIGAVPEPGCGPSASSRRTYDFPWGAIQARHGP